MILKLFTTFIVVAAILASPKHRDFTWSYRSSIYRVHWCEPGLKAQRHLLSDVILCHRSNISCFGTKIQIFLQLFVN